MPGTIGPDVALAALAVRRSHPNLPALEVLDICLRQRAGRVSDFGGAEALGTPFSFLIAEAFGMGITQSEWALARHPDTSSKARTALVQTWRDEVLPRFAQHFGLTL